MLVYEKTVNNFVHLLKTQSSLFSQENRDELIELIGKQPDEIQSFSNAISDWCGKHPEVDKALGEFESIGEKAPGSERTNKNIPKYELDKKNIINAIQQSSSSAKEENSRSSRE